MPLEKVILAEGDDNLRRTVAEFIRSKRIDVAEAGTIQDVYNYLGKDEFDLVFIDAKLPECKLLDFFGDLNQRAEKPLLIPLVNGEPDSFVLDCFKAGAFDYLAKPFSREQIEIALHKAGNFNHIARANAAMAGNVVDDADREILGGSDLIAETRTLIKRVAQTQVTVLIQGESGTGKELVARAMHAQSPRAQKPFIKINCAALPETLIESEFFGHEKGAFTGAHERRVGRFEQAEGGTLFLDEIGEIDETTQVKLLRFLGERTFERVGGNKTLTADVRVVAATNKNLKEMVGNGEFREDLYFRLSVVELWAPPLRERASDIPMLALSFLREFAEENAKPVSDFTAEALEAIIRYAWPGNVRELRTAVEHAVVLGRGDMIELAGLPQSVQSRGVIHHEKQLTQPLVDKGVTLEEAEKQLIIRTLKECRGNRTTAARKIGISRRTLHRKLNRYGLEGI